MTLLDSNVPALLLLFFTPHSLFTHRTGAIRMHCREKVNDLVTFPIEGLDLTAYVKSALSSSDTSPAIYDLYGVSEHSGSMGGGALHRQVQERQGWEMVCNVMYCVCLLTGMYVAYKCYVIN